MAVDIDEPELEPVTLGDLIDQIASDTSGLPNGAAWQEVLAALSRTTLSARDRNKVRSMVWERRVALRRSKRGAP